MLKTYILRLLIFLVGSLPLGVIRTLGNGLGTLAWLSRSRMWIVSKENIDLCYPNLDSHRRLVLAKESLRETGKTMTETCYAWTRKPATVLGKIDAIDGIEHLHASQAAGRGIVFVIPHQGNWEIINHYLGKHFGLTHMFQPNRNRHLNRYIQYKRQITGTQFVPTDRTGIKAQLKTLKAGGSIGVMPDQEPLVHTGRFAQFFGIPALTNELMRGYQRSGSDFFVAVCTRTESGFAIQFDPINFSAEKHEFLSEANLAMERAIRRHPSQYLWSYKRFRTRPEGELDYYQFDRHPLRTALETVMLSLYDRSCRQLARAAVMPLASLLTALPIAKKRNNISRVNLQLTGQPKARLKPSMQHTFAAALEAPKVWHASPQNFAKAICATPTEAAIDQLRQGAMILTPPLGSREALLRYLGADYTVTEYYHSHSVTSLDRLIRAKRTAMGIRLVEHDESGREYLSEALANNELITLCPDQQPRLRGGLFADFFGHPALTTVAIPALLRAQQKPLLLGFALRQKDGFAVHLEPLQYDPAETDQALLDLLNQQLSHWIGQHPDQYRWSDKRFNIQPLGFPKVYR
jgi:KDO2-lipid IV(A) lauroyltransferase